VAENSLTFSFLAKDKTKPGVDSVSGHLDGLHKKLSTFGAVAVGALKGAGLALGGLAAAGAVLGVKTAAQMEQAQISFTTLIGSAQKAKKFLGDLTTFANNTPFELPGLVKSSQLLLNAGVNAKAMIPTLTAWGDAASAAGSTSDQFNAAMLALSQSLGAGRINAQDMNQIVQAGIPVWKLLSESLGIPEAKVRELSASGKLLTSDVLPKLQAQMEKDYGGAMAKQSQTLNGLWSTLMDTIRNGLAKVILPLMPALRTGLTGAIKFVGAALKDLPGAIDWVATKLGGIKDFVVTNVVPGLSAAWQSVSDKLSTVKQFIETTLVPGFKTAFDKIGKSLPDIDISKVGRNFATQAANWAKDIIGGVRTGLDTGDWSPLGKSLGRGIAAALRGAGKALAEITKTLGDLLAKVDWVGIGIAMGKQAPSLFIGLVAGILNFDFLGLLKGVAKHWQEVLLAVISIAFLPGKIIGKVGELLARIPFVGKLLEWGLLAFKRFSDGLVGMVGRALGFMGKAFLEGFRRVFPAVGEGFGKALLLFPLRLQLLALEIEAKALGLMRALAAGIAKGVGWVVAKVGESVAFILKTYGELPVRMVGKGIDIIKGLARGIGAAWKFVLDMQKFIIGNFLGGFVDAGKWLVGKGGEAIGGLARGVRGGWNVAYTAARSVISTLLGAFADAGTWLIGKGGELVGGLKNGIVTVAKGIGSWAWDHVGKPIADAFDRLISFIGGLPGRISSATSGMWDGIWSAFKSTINAVIGGWNSLHFGMPSVDTHIPGIGKVGGFDVGVPQIPYLATGGVVKGRPGGTLAVLGEAGDEAVIPLKRFFDGLNRPTQSYMFAGSKPAAASQPAARSGPLVGEGGIVINTSDKPTRQALLDAFHDISVLYRV
jgi:tape measure domain-containing protein